MPLYNFENPQNILVIAVGGFGTLYDFKLLRGTFSIYILYVIQLSDGVYSVTYPGF